MPVRDLFEHVDWTRVRVHDERTKGTGVLTRRVVLLFSGNRAVTLGDHIFLPDRCRDDVPLLAHELTHCAQYQAWGAWRYFARGAAAQACHLAYRTLGLGVNPYAYTLETGKPLHAYGMEQQAQIIEDQIRGCDLRGYPPTAPARCHPDQLPSP